MIMIYTFAVGHYKNGAFLPVSLRIYKRTSPDRFAGSILLKHEEMVFDFIKEQKSGIFVLSEHFSPIDIEDRAQALTGGGGKTIVGGRLYKPFVCYNGHLQKLEEYGAPVTVPYNSRQNVRVIVRVCSDSSAGSYSQYLKEFDILAVPASVGYKFLLGGRIAGLKLSKKIVACSGFRHAWIKKDEKSLGGHSCLTKKYIEVPYSFYEIPKKYLISV